MFLEELIDGAELESQEMECKLQLDRSNPDSWLRTIAGFGNAVGGVMYIGVEDSGNKLVGFDKQKADMERNFLNNQVNEHISPRPDYRVRFISYSIRQQTRYILEVKVPESPVKPVIVRYHNIPSIYMRRQGYTSGATYEEIIQMSLKSQTAQYDSLCSEKPYQRDRFSDLWTFFDDHRENETEKLTDKALQSLGFFNQEEMLSNGATLFEDGYQGGKTLVQCSAFSGVNRGSERLVTVNRFQGNITRTIEYMLTFVQQRMNHSMIKLPTSRVDIDAYPMRALFEGIVNAVAHRDYFMDGTQIQVDMFRDRLEISSPGGFYQGNMSGKVYDLSSVISRRRNEIICAVLVKCHVMEAAGTGFDKISEAYQNADNNHKPYIICQTDHFTLVLPDLTYEDGLTGNEDQKLIYPPVENGTRFDDTVLSYCYHRARTQKDIAEKLDISNSSYLRKNVLGRLVDQDYLLCEQNSRTKYYKTNPETVHLA